MRVFLCLGVAVLGACQATKPRPRRADRDRIAIVAVERSSQGTRIVAIDDRGDRRFELVEPAREVLDGKVPFVRDDQPALSPDGRWLAFASTRGGREPTRIWIAPVAPLAVPVVVSDAPGSRWIDAHPAWSPDGKLLVFASTRDGGDFDLWQLAIADGRPAGRPEPITSGDGHEVMPELAADGSIVYAAVQGDSTSRLEERDPRGATLALTSGPFDSAPAISADGRWVAFSRQVAGESDLWILDRKPPPRGSREPVVVAELPLTDEVDPAWSADGRFLFAASLYRGDDRRPLFASVVFVDRDERKPVVRILADRLGPIVRLSPAIAANDLDASALRGNPEYVPELARILSDAIEKQAERAAP